MLFVEPAGAILKKLVTFLNFDDRMLRSRTLELLEVVGSSGYWSLLTPEGPLSVYHHHSMRCLIPCTIVTRFVSDLISTCLERNDIGSAVRLLGCIFLDQVPLQSRSHVAQFLLGQLRALLLTSDDSSAFSSSPSFGVGPSSLNSFSQFSVRLSEFPRHAIVKRNAEMELLLRYLEEPRHHWIFSAIPLLKAFFMAYLSEPSRVPFSARDSLTFFKLVKVLALFSYFYITLAHHLNPVRFHASRGRPSHSQGCRRCLFHEPIFGVA